MDHQETIQRIQAEVEETCHQESETHVCKTCGSPLKATSIYKDTIYNLQCPKCDNDDHPCDTTNGF